MAWSSSRSRVSGKTALGPSRFAGVAALVDAGLAKVLPDALADSAAAAERLDGDPLSRSVLMLGWCFMLAGVLATGADADNEPALASPASPSAGAALIVGETYVKGSRPAHAPTETPSVRLR